MCQFSGPPQPFSFSCSPGRSRSPRPGKLLPAALYGAIHVIEGETVTPILLARRFTLNPVLVVFSFVFWFWLWGVPGAILSAPILVTTKIVCDRIRPLAALGHILSG